MYSCRSFSFPFRLQVLNILQQHYVETLGRALIVNLPRLLSFFYRGISPFLDPVTRDKVRDDWCLVYCYLIHVICLQNTPLHAMLLLV